jgi:hypothetical protein
VRRMKKVPKMFMLLSHEQHHALLQTLVPLV